MWHQDKFHGKGIYATSGGIRREGMWQYGKLILETPQAKKIKPVLKTVRDKVKKSKKYQNSVMSIQSCRVQTPVQQKLNQQPQNFSMPKNQEFQQTFCKNNVISQTTQNSPKIEFLNILSINTIQSEGASQQIILKKETPKQQPEAFSSINQIENVQLSLQMNTQQSAPDQKKMNQKFFLPILKKPQKSLVPKISVDDINQNPKESFRNEKGLIQNSVKKQQRKQSKSIAISKSKLWKNK